MATKKKTVDSDHLAATTAEALTEDNLTKLSVYLTDGAADAMTRASESTGDSKTDTINRALHLYAAVVTAEAGATISFDRAGDGPRPDEGKLPRVRRVAIVE